MMPLPRSRHRPSTIDRLEKPIREEINRLRIDDGKTIDEILAHLKTMGGPAASVSRSALGRHVVSIEKVGERIRELRGVAEGISKAVGEGDNAKVAALNRELTHSILMRVATATDERGDDVQFSPAEANFIAMALHHLASAEKVDVERVLRVRKDTAERAARTTESELKKLKLPGLTKDTIQAIRQQVLGVAG